MPPLTTVSRIIPELWWYRLLGLGYRWARAGLVAAERLRTSWTHEVFDYETIVERGDRWLSQLRKQGPDWLTRASIGNVSPTQVYDLTFPSPLTVAAFQSNQEILKLWLDLGAGGVILKTILPAPCPGNPRPRLAALPRNGSLAFVNALGLPGPGIDIFLEQLDPALFAYGRPVGFSLGGNSPEDYIRNVEKVCRWSSEHSQPSVFLELNISCPNTPEGQNLSLHPRVLGETLSQIDSLWPGVVSVKLSPDAPDDLLHRLADQCSRLKKPVLNAGNTRRVFVRELGLTGKQFVPATGGLSGPPLKSRTLELIRTLHGHGFPLIATGGLETATDVREALDSGATLVGMATGLVKNMYLLPAVNRDLAHA
ncbi:MAG: hypothetical protein D6762_01775 [Candidatus Neomarinimicrobiota bacterium]|nr:MAG: hypothetical protein D6762_01775 [Candidatus Neomarinimicrobiota bacterium]